MLPYQKYKWASNESKLLRAFATLNKEADIDPRIEVTEEAVLVEYKRYAGLVIEEFLPKTPSKKPKAEKDSE